MMFDASTSSPDRSSTHSLSTESASLSSSSSSSSSRARAGRLPSRASLVVGFVAGWRLKSARQSARFERAASRASHLLRRRRVGGVDVAGALRRDGDVVVLAVARERLAAHRDAMTIETRARVTTPRRQSDARSRRPRAMATGDVWTDMAVIFTAILATMLASYATLTPVKTTRRRTTTTAATSGARWFACAKTRASKAEGEMFCLKYSACWIASVGVVIATRAYESFGRWGYLAYCGACAAPAIVAPLMRPSASDRGKALERAVHREGERVDRGV